MYFSLKRFYYNLPNPSPSRRTSASASIMSLVVLVRAATGLANSEVLGGTSDPYVTVTFRGEKQKTSVQKSTLEPHWDEELTWALEEGKPITIQETLEVTVKDKERMGKNKLMGAATIALTSLASQSTSMELQQNLNDSSNAPTQGLLNLCITSTGSESGGGSRDVSPEDNSDTTPLIGKSGKSSNVKSQNSNNFNPTKGGVRRKYQIRGRIIEGRQLLGSNMDPFGRVTMNIGHEKFEHQTRVVLGNNNPEYDSTFTFTCECTQLELINAKMNISILTAASNRMDSTIGNHQMSIAMLYDQPKKSIINKWIVLGKDSNETRMLTGYVKVSIAVSGSDGRCPDLPITESNPEKEDIESNILWSGGVVGERIILTLGVLSAMDLPRMDQGAMQNIKKLFSKELTMKALVDPYVVFQFAGQTLRTKTIHGSDCPDFDEQLQISVLWPSVCQNITLSIMDADRVGKDDVIGIAVIPVEKISSAGDGGFLPSFGPSFVNLYGGRRDWEMWESSSNERQNKGEEKGVAYRGRLMVTVSTTVGNGMMGPLLTAPVSPIDSLVLHRSKKHRTTVPFTAMAQVRHLTLLSDASRQLQLELSIGNFGNKFERKRHPCPSTSQPTNPIFDGSRYHSLGWGPMSPLLQVEGRWEDVSSRFYAANTIKSAAEALQKSIDDVNAELAKGNPPAEVMPAMKEAIQCALNTTRNNVDLDAEFHKSPQTVLDTNLKKFRAEVFKHLAEKSLATANSWQEHSTSAITNGKNENTKHEGQESVNFFTGLLNQLQSLCDQMKRISIEPQSSMPDVTLWLMSGSSRLGFVRVEAADLLYNEEEGLRGAKCGVMKHYCLHSPDDEKLVGVLEASIWLGHSCDVRKWWNSREYMSIIVFAECYENMISAPGSASWSSSSSLLPRPPFSDADGNIPLPKDTLLPPQGWVFAGDWFISTGPSEQVTASSNPRFREEVWQQQVRNPTGGWISSPTPWTDTTGDPAPPNQEIECPPGWEWVAEWEVDLGHACDDEGWQYGLPLSGGGSAGWQCVYRAYHVWRRRKWARERKVVGDTSSMVSIASSGGDEEGWEYSSMFGRKYHARRRAAVDIVRRRRWRRKMVPEVATSLVPPPPVVVQDGTGNEALSLPSPYQYLVSSTLRKYQMRAHVYQARELLSTDSTGLSDPFAVVSFSNFSQETEKVGGTLCPVWDQTVIFNDVTLDASETPPPVVVTIFDWDVKGEPDFIGRVIVQPEVQNPAESYKPTPLQWYQLQSEETEDGETRGEVLLSLELLLGGLEKPPPKRGEIYMLPADIRPMMKKMRLEILCWSVWNLSSYQLRAVSRPQVEFECGGQKVASSILPRPNANFSDPVLVVDAELPVELSPTLSLRVYDNRPFGSHPLVASALISNLGRFRASSNRPKAPNRRKSTRRNGTDALNSPVNKKIPTEGADWWSRFYASFNNKEEELPTDLPSLPILPHPLEEDSRWGGFRDLLSSHPLRRGKGANAETVGEFKGTFRLYEVEDAPMKPLLGVHQGSSTQPITIRVYAVMATNLTARDIGGLSDPYICVSLGPNTSSTVKDYRPNTLNPLFGQMIEVSGVLPQHKDLVIGVWDKDMTSSDDLIGQTSIDVENRLHTRHRASVPLSSHYHESGLLRWRDRDLPSTILLDYAKQNNLKTKWGSEPLSLTLDTSTYTLDQIDNLDCLACSQSSPRDRLALYALQEEGLVHEHLETRPLWNPARPGLSQGDLLMWVDIFSGSEPLPPPVDISPRKAKKKEVRMIVYNAYDVPMQETNIAGESMSDVYLKGWMKGTNKKQKTDIHYRCLDGEANFNWRFCFPVDYIAAEQRMVVRRKNHLFAVDPTEDRLPPCLKLQLWDNDLISRDDFLSETTLDLCNLPMPSKSVSKVQLPPHLVANNNEPTTTSDGTNTYIRMRDNDTKGSDNPAHSINLFTAKRVYGFFPFTKLDAEGNYELGGCIEAEIEVLDEQETLARPAGLGRSEPNMNPCLEEPNRPATSFLWFTSPWKSFKHVIWRNYKWHIITAVVVFFLFLFAFLVLYSLPGATVDYLVGVD